MQHNIYILLFSFVSINDFIARKSELQGAPLSVKCVNKIRVPIRILEEVFFSNTFIFSEL